MKNFVNNRYKFIKYGLLMLAAAILLIFAAFSTIFLSFTNMGDGNSPPDIAFGFLSVLPIAASFVLVAMGTVGMILNAIFNVDPYRRKQDIVLSVFISIVLANFIVKGAIPAFRQF